MRTAASTAGFSRRKYPHPRHYAGGADAFPFDHRGIARLSSAGRGVLATDETVTACLAVDAVTG
jgi:hypothetical protein